MPKVHKVLKARKPIKSHGIKVGDTYYWWKNRPKGSRNGIKRISKKYPRPSQLTMSDYYSQAYALQEEFEDEVEIGCVGKDGLENLKELLTNTADSVRELGEAQQEKFDNMPDGLQQGDTGQLIEGRARCCETLADALQEYADGLDSWEEPEPPVFESGKKKGQPKPQSEDDRMLQVDEDADVAIQTALDGIDWMWEE